MLLKILSRRCIVIAALLPTVVIYQTLPAKAQTSHSRIVEDVYQYYTNGKLFTALVGLMDACLLGRPDGVIPIHTKAAPPKRPFTAVEFCITIHAAAAATGLMRTNLYRRKESAGNNPAFAFAVGFGFGLSMPERYATYLAADPQLMDSVSADCVVGKGGHKECEISGALQAIRAKADLDRLAKLYPAGREGEW
ncbi:MAG: hypothetical protein NW215_00500 [Hyphomicrobiales bacterium]|nr:hypothetical protein [Hyphomicrobiales bacterium]